MSSPRRLTLPDELLSMICQELGDERDFGTLYRCALSSKSLADPALRTIYQIYQHSPAFEQRDDLDTRSRPVDFATKAADYARFFKKWTLLWRSITLSSLDNPITYKPYCRYLKTLDFRNLSLMLEDPKFSGPVRTAFYAAPLRSFHFLKTEYRRQVIDIVATINAIGEAITAKTTQLEEIDGHMSPGFLPRWISRSPKLESMVLWKGDALVNGAGAAIAEHCDNFQSLTIREWRSPDADESFATYLRELKADTLTYFNMISWSDIGQQSFHALGRHTKLLQLELSNLDTDAVRNLNALKHCTAVHTLKLDDGYGTVQLEEYQNDVFLDVVEWLTSCKDLRDLTLKKFHDGPAILSRVLPSPNVKLNKLSLEGYTVRNMSAQLFHSVLSEQKSTLESLWLKGSGEDTTPDDLQIMVEALCSLTNLQELVLKDVSDEFTEDHIISLSISLPLLEDFWTSGGEVTSGILPALAQLQNIKTLTLYAMTQFSSTEIMDFLGGLDPERQKGLNLSLMAADPTFDLSEKEQGLIRDYMSHHLDGRFDFVVWREADLTDSDDD